MGIYIPGTEIPKDGKVVLIDPWGNVRLYWSKDVVAVGTGLYLCKASELPPHGRLGDLDAFESIKYELPDGQKAFNRGFHSGVQYVQRLIMNAPTIIPAGPEGGGADG